MPVRTKLSLVAYGLTLVLGALGLFLLAAAGGLP